MYERDQKDPPPNSSVIRIIESDPFLRGLAINEVSALSDGVAHEVYRLTTGDENYYLKIRGDHFPRVPDILCRPGDIKNEYKALIIYSALFPDHFPKVCSFSEDEYYLVLSDAVYNGDLLQRMLIEGEATPDTILNLAETLRNIHDLTSGYKEDIRDDGDDRYYEQKLLHRFGFAPLKGLEKLIEELRRQPRQLIIGDPAPKNIGVNDNGERLIFFDLEDVHQGNTVFDFGYLLGQIVLHTLNSPDALEYLLRFLEGYGESSFDQDVVKKIVLGTIRYRLIGKIPYPIPNIPVELRNIIIEQLNFMISHDLANTDWRELIGGLINE